MIGQGEEDVKPDILLMITPQNIFRHEFVSSMWKWLQVHMKDTRVEGKG